MAGDWMKIELELPDKPEVHAISGMVNKDPEWVVGALIKVWGWFDKHTTDGNAHGVTYSLPDRITGVTGFGEAMSFVGWLDQQDKYLVMPKFDRHTSASAKKRALTQKRVEKNRNVNVTHEALPREEKRREDIEKKNNKKKIPAELKPNDLHIQFCVNHGLDVQEEFDQFIAHHSAKGSTYADWNAAFRTWIGNAAKWAAEKKANQAKSSADELPWTRDCE